jgi:hypothetical protein
MTVPLRNWDPSGGTDEFGITRAAGLDDPVAHPAHAAGVFDAVAMGKAKVAREIGAYSVGVKHRSVEQRRQRNS